MRSRVLSALFLLVLFVSAWVVAARNSVYTFPSGASFIYPTDWDIIERDDGVDVANDRTFVRVLDDVLLSSLDIGGDDLESILESYMGARHGSAGWDAADAEEVELDTRTALTYEYRVGDNRGLVVTVPFANGSFGVVDALSKAGRLRDEGDILDIAESFNSGEAVVSSDGADCTVSTDAADTVRVRVGPGENRTSIAFLPTGQDFIVQGKATADDDSLWYKLDKAEVAPNKAVNEVWVAVAEVESVGNCDAVVDVNAPPIVPIINAPPPTAAPSGETQSGGETQPSTTSGGTTPQSGSWTLSLNAVTNASCTGISNVSFPTSEVYGVMSVRVNISISGDSLRLNDAVLSRTGPNSFQGSVTLAPGLYVTIVTVVQSPTLITGAIVEGFTLEGRSCNASTDFTMTR